MSGAVLVVTSIDDMTADLVITALNRRGVPVVRVDTGDLGHGLTFAGRTGGDGCWSGFLRTRTRELDLARVRAVYHRRPSPYRFDHLDKRSAEFAAREARYGLGGLLAALPVPHINDPFATARAEYKPMQLTVAGQVGLRPPVTLVTNDLLAVRDLNAEQGPIVYKALRGVPGSDGTAGVIWTGRVDPGQVDESVSVTAHLFQVEVPKEGDIRVAMVGDSVFAYQVESGGELKAPLDWRSGDWAALRFTSIEVPGDVRAGMRSYLDRFGLVTGQFDFTDDWTFIECNPDGQWAFLPGAESVADAIAAVLGAQGWPA